MFQYSDRSQIVDVFHPDHHSLIVLIRYRMHKALRSSAPLPYPQLVTLFIHHFEIPLNSESFVQIKRSFAIGVGAVTSFSYRKDKDGQWLKKDAQPPQDERTPSPLSQRDDSSTLMHEVLSELRGLRTYVGERFDSLDGRIDVVATCPLRASVGEAHVCAFQRRKGAWSRHQSLFVENIGKTEGNRSKW